MKNKYINPILEATTNISNIGYQSDIIPPLIAIGDDTDISTDRDKLKVNASLQNN
ncbi:hypothetical protein [Halanaerobaculum tunisiense]